VISLVKVVFPDRELENADWLKHGHRKLAESKLEETAEPEQQEEKS